MVPHASLLTPEATSLTFPGTKNQQMGCVEDASNTEMLLKHLPHILW